MSKNFPELLGVFGDYRANRSDDFASQFNLRRARLLFLGHLLSPDFKYFLQIGFETAENAQTPGSANLLDYYVLSTHFPLFNVQLGQYKIFFNRSQINNTASMQFAERALVMDAFTASGLNRRDIGITIMNDDEIYPVNYYLGIFNGAGPLFNRYGTYNSEEATVGCPGGQTGGNPFPFSGRMPSQFAQSQCKCSRRDRQADVCRPAPVEYSGTTGIWRRRFGLFRSAADGGGRRTRL